MKNIGNIFNFIFTQSLLLKSQRTLRHTCPNPLNKLTRRTFNLSCSAMVLKKSLSDWSFSDPKLASLPLDTETGNTVRRHVPGAVFSVVQPTPWKSQPKLVAFSQDVLENILDFDPVVTENPFFVDFVSGNLVLPGSVPMAHRYGGHQFGYWADQLGDGRAHLLGEYINSKGDRWELQLKGSGKTPYSRFADGRAVLRSSVREFLCSEAMHWLGVPTSRAATLTVTEDGVPRDMFYDGRMKMERGAVVLRLAPTWFRFGSLEILAKNKELSELKQLADFILTNSFTGISETGQEGYLAMFSEVVDRTADMIARWSVVGFAHGVMNTDNMSIMGVTIDYGPFGFIDEYNPKFIPNHSDDMGRYDLENQVNIGLWNLDKLADALKPLLDIEKHKQFEMILQGYGEMFQKYQMSLYRAKLGLTGSSDSDELLLGLLLDTMETTEADFTQTFRDLSELSLQDLKELKIPESAWGLSQCLKSKQIKEFLKLYVEKIENDNIDDESRMTSMQKANPRYILRNWMAQKAIEMAEENDFSEVQFLHEVLINPFQINKAAEEKGYAKPPPRWSKKLAVSCSS